MNPAFSSYAPYFPKVLSPETQRGKRTARLLKTIGISSLAGLVGVASYLCYREARAWLEASKESGQGQQTSQTLAPGPAAKSSSEIALVRNSSAEGTEAPGAPLARAGSVPGPQDPTKPQTSPAANELLLVQVAAYTRQADALNLVDSLRAQDFIAFVSPPVTDEYYRVQLGPYTTLEAAQIGKRELEKAGFTPFIRH
jgi:cell division septation protein DedD